MSRRLASASDLNGANLAYAATFNGEHDVYYLRIVSCQADLDGNGLVEVLDLFALFAAWGTNPGGPPDLDGDGTVGITDMFIMFGAWGPC